MPSSNKQIYKATYTHTHTYTHVYNLHLTVTGGTLAPHELNFLICKITLPFLNHKILEPEEHYRSLSPTPLVSPVMFTSSLLENHFKIKINIPFTCNIIIEVLLGSHTRQ